MKFLIAAAVITVACAADPDFNGVVDNLLSKLTTSPSLEVTPLDFAGDYTYPNQPSNKVLSTDIFVTNDVFYGLNEISRADNATGTKNAHSWNVQGTFLLAAPFFNASATFNYTTDSNNRNREQNWDVIGYTQDDVQISYDLTYNDVFKRYFVNTLVYKNYPTFLVNVNYNLGWQDVGQWLEQRVSQETVYTDSILHVLTNQISA